MDHILSARVGNNADLFPDVLRLYVPEGSVVADATWGRGIFWKKVDQSKYRILRSDIAPDRGDITADFRNLPYVASSCDALVLDPPYLHVGGFKTMKYSLDGIYRNEERANRLGIYGTKSVLQMYHDGIREARRVLRIGGILIVKCMDQIESGKQQWDHINIMQSASDEGFLSEDMFVLVSSTKPLMRHKPEQQKHARRCHSYFLIFRRRREKRNAKA